MLVERSPAVSQLVVVVGGGGVKQLSPCPFYWRLGSCSHSCRVEGGRGALELSP